MIRNALPKEPGTTHRHWLSRIWGGEDNLVLVVGINPSTACASINDPFVNDMIKILYHRFTGMILVNVSDIRSSKPEVFKSLSVVRSNSNLEHIREQARNCTAVIFACGPTNYGPKFKDCREETLKEIRSLFSGDSIFVFGVNGEPYYYNSHNIRRGLVDGNLYKMKG